ncbi:hypothetical protein D3C84_1201090 [compost metagenome]
MPLTLSMMVWAQTSITSPSEVIETRRVVRLNSLHPKVSSSAAMRLLTWAGEIPSSLPAAMKLARLAIVEKRSKSRKKGSLFTRGEF